MNNRLNNPARSEGEFIALVALLISLVALAIDAMLPALPQIGTDLGVTHNNDRQQVITVFFIGLGIGQLFYGPLSDSIGRKPAIYGGLVLFMVGNLLSVFANSFELMLLGRLLQGLGAAGPRIVVIAMVRDQYEGRAMAKVMSMVMAVFILVPAMAPALGQGILLVWHWRAIFILFFTMAAIGFIWLLVRQSETLLPEQRTAVSAQRLYRNIREIFLNRIVFGYMIATGFIFAAFVGYLTSAQQIFQELYMLGEMFPLYFAILSIAIGAASLANSRLVMRYGMSALCRWSLVAIVVICGGFFIYAMVLDDAPPLWTFMTCFICSFFAMGILFGNLNALAMEPMGHIAGTAAAVIGSITTIISLVLGAAIGTMFDGSVLPVVGGFAGFGALSLVVMQWTDGKRIAAS